MRYINKEESIIDLSKAKKVLHLGCIGFADLKTINRTNLAAQTLHYKLTKFADTIGVDYSYDVIKYYEENDIFTNIIYGNVEQLEDIHINNTFDVIVAGDILEHVSNPGLVLEGIKRFCCDTTIIVITVPHSFGLMNFIRFIFGRFAEGKEHVMSFNSQNLINLLSRHGYNIDSIDTCYQKHAMKKIAFPLGLLTFRIFPKFGGTLFTIARYLKFH